ncbi:MAG: nuclear transport factor 2 family protein [Hyphomicrobiaceae bacterium]|nr:nuclear transport factor 2 family protein [Hyphomicrobiaceae bacterium]
MSAQGLLDAWYAAIKSGDAERLRAVITDDAYIFWNGDGVRIPWAGRHVGADAMMAFFRTLGGLIEVVQISETGRIVAETHAIVTITGRWRHKPSGKQIDATACNVFRLRDGRISAYEVYNDTAQFDAALHAET